MSMKEDLESILTEWKKLGANIKQKEDHWTLCFENDKAKVYIEYEEDGEKYINIETNQFENNIYNENLGYEPYKNLEYELVKTLVRSINKHKMSEEWNNILHKYSQLVRDPNELASKISQGCLVMNKNGLWQWFNCPVDVLYHEYGYWETDDSDLDEDECYAPPVELEYLDWNYKWKQLIDCNKPIDCNKKDKECNELQTLEVLKEYAQIPEDVDSDIRQIKALKEKYGDMPQEERDLYNTLEKYKDLKVSQKTKNLMKTFL